MAGIKTTVRSPIGPVMSFDGRVSRAVAIQQTRDELNREINRAQAHLAEVDNWSVESHRGSMKVLGADELGQ